MVFKTIKYLGEYKNNRKLVAFFSASGVIVESVKVLVAVTGAELYEIKPKIPYNEADLDWNDNQSCNVIVKNFLIINGAAKGLPDTLGIIIVSSTHVECVVLMSRVQK